MQRHYESDYSFAAAGLKFVEILILHQVPLPLKVPICKPVFYSLCYPPRCSDVDPWIMAGLLYLGAGVGLAAFHLLRRPLLIADAEAPLRRSDLPCHGHEPIMHRHPHYPDLHHRHEHKYVG